MFGRRSADKPGRKDVTVEAGEAEAVEEAPKYSRVLLKLSGEALMGDQGFGIDPQIVRLVQRYSGLLHR